MPSHHSRLLMIAPSLGRALTYLPDQGAVCLGIMGVALLLAMSVCFFSLLHNWNKHRFSVWSAVLASKVAFCQHPCSLVWSHIGVNGGYRYANTQPFCGAEGIGLSLGNRKNDEDGLRVAGCKTKICRKRMLCNDAGEIERYFECLNCQGKVSRINNIELNGEASLGIAGEPSFPFLDVNPLLHTSLLQQNTVPSRFSGFAGSFGLVDEDENSPCGNGESRPIIKNWSQKVFAPVRLIRLIIGTFLFFLGAWPGDRRPLIPGSRRVDRLLCVALIVLGLICLFWDRMKTTKDQQSRNEPSAHIACLLRSATHTKQQK